jgi:hypothetical protein
MAIKRTTTKTKARLLQKVSQGAKIDPELVKAAARGLEAKRKTRSSGAGRPLGTPLDPKLHRVQLAIRELRAAMKMKQADFAQTIGVSKRTAIRYENPNTEFVRLTQIETRKAFERLKSFANLASRADLVAVFEAVEGSWRQRR